MGFAFGWISLLLPLLLIALFLAPCLWVIIRTVTRPRRGVSQPSCEKCRYPVAGLTTLACPECGADLRRTGIITRPMEMRRRGSLLGAILALTVLVAALMIVSLQVMTWWVFMRATPSSKVSVVLTPTSTAYRSIDLAFDYDSGPERVTAVLSCVDGKQSSLIIDVPSRTFTLASETIGSTLAKPRDEHTLREWFEGVGIDTSDAVVASELADLDKAVDLAAAGSLDSINTARLTELKPGAVSFPTYPSATPGVHQLISAITLLSLLALYLLGIFFIIRRRRSLLREADAADVSAAASPAPTPVAQPS